MAEQHLTKSELAIMEVMWEQEEALTASEIIKASGDKEWKNSSIHLMVNALLEKGIHSEVIIDRTFYKKSYVQNQILGRALMESIVLLHG